MRSGRNGAGGEAAARIKARCKPGAVAPVCRPVAALISGSFISVLVLCVPRCAAVAEPLYLFGFDFVLFGLTLLGVALFHHHTLALTGLGVITLYELAVTGRC